MNILLIVFLVPSIATYHHTNKPNFARFEYMRSMKKYVRKLNDWLRTSDDDQLHRVSRGKHATVLLNGDPFSGAW